MQVLLVVALSILGACVAATAESCASYFQSSNAQRVRTVLDVPAGGYQSCAIMGSSGLLLYERLGAEIDQHEMVLRLNLAPEKGFEPVVGSKTTIRDINTDATEHLLSLSKTDNVDICPPYTVIFTGQPDTLARYQAVCGNRTRIVPGKSAVNQDIASQMTPMFQNVMSGPAAISVALSICAKGVNIYGLSSTGNEAVSADKPYHYYDDCGLSPFDSLSSTDVLVSNFIADHSECATMNEPLASDLSEKYNYSNATGPHEYDFLSMVPVAPCHDDTPAYVFFLVVWLSGPVAACVLVVAALCWLRKKRKVKRPADSDSPLLNDVSRQE